MLEELIVIFREPSNLQLLPVHKNAIRHRIVNNKTVPISKYILTLSLSPEEEHKQRGHMGYFFSVNKCTCAIIPMRKYPHMAFQNINPHKAISSSSQLDIYLGETDHFSVSSVA